MEPRKEDPGREPEPDAYPENEALARDIINSLDFGPQPPVMSRETAEERVIRVLRQISGRPIGHLIARTHADPTLVKILFPNEVPPEDKKPE